MVDRDIHAEVTALKAVLAATIGALVNRDPDIARDILRTCEVLTLPRDGVTHLDPSLEAVAVEVHNFLDELRREFGTE